MATPEPPAPYRVVYSDAVKQCLRELSDESFARGDGPEFTSALKEFERLFRLYPQFGDPVIDLTAAPGQIYNGILRPLSMRYGVYEDRRLVMIGALPRPLPMDKPEEA